MPSNESSPQPTYWACLGIIVDAKDEDAERFYSKYGFAPLPPATWPQRMFLSVETARAAFA